MVNALGANNLTEPRFLVPHGEALFGGLVSWGVKAAISKIDFCITNDINASVQFNSCLSISDIYNERREDFLKEEVVQRAQRLDDTAVVSVDSRSASSVGDPDRSILLEPCVHSISLLLWTLWKNRLVSLQAY